MKKKTVAFGMALMTMVLGTNIMAFAGSWKNDSRGYWWQNDDGSYPVNCWQWLDGNQDGISECYYFDGSGYMLANTTTPDGYQVNGDGAWTVNGVVQTKGQQESVSYEEISDAYQNYLSTVSVEFGKIKYDLVYLNNDNIPELMYAFNSSHAHGVNICTYQDGVVYPLSSYESGTYGSVSYFPKTGYIWYEDMHMGYEMEELEVMKGTTLQEVYYVEYNTGEDPGNGTTKYDKFRLNGSSSTKSAIMNYKNQLIGHLTPSIFSYDDALEYHK